MVRLQSGQQLINIMLFQLLYPAFTVKLRLALKNNTVLLLLLQPFIMVML